jgi:cytochrome oxidase assembly protein ShyY1
MSPGTPEEAPAGPIGPHGLRANLKFAGLTLVLLPLMVGLGFWQLHRADEKAAELAEMELKRAAAPLPVTGFAAMPAEELDGRRVELRGRYDAERSFLLDNRILRGRVGYELLTLFRDESGAVLLVDRGWLQAPPTRERLPAVDTPPEPLRLTGEFYVPEDRRRLPLYPGQGWPRVVQALDVPELARLASEPDAFPHLVVLDDAQPGVSEGEHARVNMPPARHTAYAVQWFLMAAAWFVVFLLGGTNAREPGRSRRRRNEFTDANR